MQALKSRGRFALLLAMIVLIPLLVLYIALQFVDYEQTNSTKHINVAVVNNDQSATFQDTTVHAGQDVQAKLKHNKDVTWHFVSAAVADKNLKNGTYLMKVTLPKDFSRNVTTALAKNPQKSTIQVALSAHNNFASHMITETVAEKLQAQVVQNVQQAYDATALAAIKQLADGVDQAHDGTQQLKAGTDQISDGFDTLTANNDTLTGGAVQMADGVEQIIDGNNQLLAGNQQVTSGATTLAASLRQAAAQIQGQLKAGAPDLARLDEALTTLTNGTAQLAAGVNDPKMTKLDGDIAANVQGLGDNAKALQAGLLGLNAAIFDQTAANSAASQLKAAGADFTSVGAALTDLKSSMMSDSGVMKFFITHPDKLKELLGVETSMKSGEKEMNAVASQLMVGGIHAMKMKDALTKTGAALPALGELLTTLHNNMNTLKAGVNQLNDKQNGAPALAAGVRQAINTLTAGLNEVQAGLTRTGNTTSTMGAVQGATKLADGSSQLGGGLDQLHSGLAQLYTGLTGTKTQVGLIDGLTQYTDGTTQLQDGSKQVAAGVTELNVKLGEGASQVKGLNTGSANVDHFVSPVANQTQADPLAKPLLSVLAPVVILMVAFIAALLTELGFGRYSKSFASQPLLKRAAVVALAVALQALGIALLTAAMGVAIASPVIYFLALFATGGLFTMIIFAFDRWFGTLGVLATLVILFLQLIASGGLLPSAMLSGFYRFVRYLLPGTYALDLFNSAINGLQTASLLDWIVLLGIAALVGVILWLPRRSQSVDSENVVG
ncbi:YhgE/Pip domain-containing protein [Lacticaseibacillus salsurivasis]|uniref:YhgE/Pip domain-containing protein n=1 Tax=Lacticaseibacillus salsurivasis TaxID=3081441 RepID=UPI0030C66B52